MDPVFSVIIPTKNEEKQIYECLERIFQQDTDLSYEVILVDSSTNDHTRKIGESFKATVIEEIRPGKGIAVHTGASRAKGSILCFTEADCRVTPHWLSAIYRAFQDDPRTVAVTGAYDYHDADRFTNLIKAIGLPVSIWGYYFLHGNHSIRGTNFAVLASAYRDAGGFSLKAKEFQDVELGLRLRKLGKIRLVPAMKITTSARRLQGRLIKFIKEFTPAIFTLLVLKKVPEKPTYEDIR